MVIDNCNYNTLQHIAIPGCQESVKIISLYYQIILSLLKGCNNLVVLIKNCTNLHRDIIHQQTQRFIKKVKTSILRGLYTFNIPNVSNFITYGPHFILAITTTTTTRCCHIVKMLSDSNMKEGLNWSAELPIQLSRIIKIFFSCCPLAETNACYYLWYSLNHYIAYLQS
jgi:hypothetical protein